MGSCCRETGGRGAERHGGGYICAGFHAYARQRTNTVTPVVRGFKIDGDEGGWGGKGSMCNRLA